MGFCSKCGAWLGHSNTANQSLSHDSEWEIWKSDNIGDLLQKSSSGLSFPPQETITKALNLCVSYFAKDNIALWAKQLQIPRNTLWLWCKGQNSPTLQAILKVCYCLKVSVWDFLHHNFDCSIILSAPPKLKSPVRSSSQTIVKYHLEASLQAILATNKEPPLSMEEVARQLGYDKRTIFRHCPELCRSISAWYSDYQKRAYLKKLSNCCAEVKQAVIDLHAQGEYPS